MPVLRHLEEVLAEDDDDTTLTRDIKRRIMASLTARFSDAKVNELLNIASFLDPRFKLDSVADEDKDALNRCVREEASRVQLMKATGNQQEPQAPEQPPCKKRRLGDILKKKQSSSSTTSTEDRINTEIERYLQAPNPDSDSDPLDWWRVHAQVYLHISKLAKHYLLCATSSASERLFSTSGNVVTKKRSSLKPTKVDMLVFF